MPKGGSVFSALRPKCFWRHTAKQAIICCKYIKQGRGFRRMYSVGVLLLRNQRQARLRSHSSRQLQ